MAWRLIALILAVAIIATLLAGCAPRPQPFDVERFIRSPGWYPVEVD